jgi:predicted RNase H-like nuclease
MRALGLDGYRKGWVYAWIDEAASTDYGTVKKIGDIENIQFGSAMIDVPIGLPDSGYRHCDRAAREFFPPDRRSCVFLGARRPLLEHAPKPYDREGNKRRFQEANEWAKADPGKGISQQMFGIFPKIKEVDSFITPQKQKVIREAHPELAFWRLNGRSPLPNKKTPEGQLRRLIKQAGFTHIEEWLARRPANVKVDDLLDACVCACVARSSLSGKGNVVTSERCDAKSLRMEICY